RARPRRGRHAGRPRGGGDCAVAGETSRVISLTTVRRALRDHRPQVVDAPDARPAAVALVLLEGPHGLEILLIRRAERTDDPWSGQIALPGGRYGPGDLDLEATAVRETREETLTLRGGPRTFPAYLVDEELIWGMTERILTPFVDLVTSLDP